jgi:hypothetical protein
MINKDSDFFKFFISIFVLKFENFITIKKPIVLLLNDSDKKNSKKIKEFFKGERGVKIYDKDFDENKILSISPKLVIDINENKFTKGIYINASKQIFDKIKASLLNNSEIPFIGKQQINKNKKLELDLFKRGLPYIYIEFPIHNFNPQTILKTQLIILKRFIKLI